ncbi:hypothetical protein B1A99_08735 [Cohnella sp. CIP 111063]|uniref:cache domain-containing sensor histidine kinase n=1 Tax=unclassified Cohnella TaxID=2636738 RepID=UPI000B8C480D|nr:MULTISPECIES: sensor histidine kinase [unclassified Cohnella]OXS60497.1 hypothetical protein B1A99_08735 [Cohnella sp. CIP 111063]PRX73204.1 two-component system sensor histidine kinase YesM [Cohnella sp. SGD-V74]
MKPNSIQRFFRSAAAYLQLIKWKLFISYVILSVLPISVISVVLYSQATKTIENKIAVYSRQIIYQTVGKLDGKLESVQDLSLQIVADAGFQERLERVRKQTDSELATREMKDVERELDRIIGSRSDVVGAEIVLSGSDRVMSSGEYLVSPRELGNDPAYSELMSQSGAYAWKGAVNYASSQVLYPNISILMRKIKSLHSGEDIGVLVMGIKEFALADTYSYIDLGPTGFVFVVDSDRRLVSHLDKSELNRVSDYPFISRIVRSSVDESRTFPSYLDDRKVLVSYGVSELADWYMVSVVPYDYLTEDIGQIRTVSVRLGLILLLISVFVSFYISSTISRPAEVLVRAMRRVESGDLSVNVSLRTGNEIGMLGGHFNHMVRRMNELIKRVYESELVKKEAEVKALQSQINPHFLYNTLSIIDSMASIKKEKEISELAQRLSDIFRYSISGNDVSTIREEINQVERYLYIQKIRYKDKISETIEVDPETEKGLITKLLLQPIVENAIVHGICKSRTPGHLTIKVYLSSEETLKIEVADDGAGMSRERLKEVQNRLREADRHSLSVEPRDGNIGIANVHRRIRHTFGEEYGLEIDSEPGKGTRVVMKIPMLT